MTESPLLAVIPQDPGEIDAYMVCLRSLRARCSRAVRVFTLVETHLRAMGLFYRAQRRAPSGLVDLEDGKPCSTDFSFTRFLVPFIPGLSGWVLFCDSDFLWRADAAELLALADDAKAVMVVRHRHVPAETVKMRGQEQTVYPRKNWSSLVLWNLAHPAHARLGLEDVNRRPGRDLHGFYWLADDEIGALPESWNWLEGHSDPAISPRAVHFTRGTPNMPGREAAAYAGEWRDVLDLGRAGESPRASTDAPLPGRAGESPRASTDAPLPGRAGAPGP